MLTSPVGETLSHQPLQHWVLDQQATRGRRERWLIGVSIATGLHKTDGLVGYSPPLASQRFSSSAGTEGAAMTAATRALRTMVNFILNFFLGGGGWRLVKTVKVGRGITSRE